MKRNFVEFFMRMFVLNTTLKVLMSLRGAYGEIRDQYRQLLSRKGCIVPLGSHTGSLGAMQAPYSLHGAHMIL